MNMPEHIVTVTLNPCVDQVFSIDQLVPDRKLRARGVVRYPGGGGVNVARAAARLGADVLALWSRGGDTGELLADLLQREYVAHAGIAISEPTRENFIVFEVATEQQFRFGLPGPRLGANELDAWCAAMSAIDRKPAYVVVSGSNPPGVSDDWFGEFVRSAKGVARVIVDTKGGALRQALNEGVYLVKPNARELEELAGRMLDGDDDVEAVARDIVAQGGAEAVLVSLGRAGAMLATKQGVQPIRAPAVRLRSKVGAGDSMVGGLVAGLASGLPLEEAAKLSVAAGAAAVMTEGTELCQRADVERLYARLSG
jgi:6-phosphofructokinase 2